MSFLSIAQLGNPILRKKSQPVDNNKINTPEFQKLLRDMKETMIEFDGVGLAAPQIYQSIQTFVFMYQPNESEEKFEIKTAINPIVTPLGEQKNSDYESCLSLDGLHGFVPRYSSVRLEALDEKGNPYTLEIHDFWARVIQHEYDHLIGTIFLERMDSLQSLSFRREFKKYHLDPRDSE